MLVGSIVTSIYIILEKFVKIDMQGMLGSYYVSSEGIGTIGLLPEHFGGIDRQSVNIRLHRKKFRTLSNMFVVRALISHRGLQWPRV